MTTEEPELLLLAGALGSLAPRSAGLQQLAGREDPDARADVVGIAALGRAPRGPTAGPVRFPILFAVKQAESIDL